MEDVIYIYGTGRCGIKLKNHKVGKEPSVQQEMEKLVKERRHLKKQWKKASERSGGTAGRFEITICKIVQGRLPEKAGKGWLLQVCRERLWQGKEWYPQGTSKGAGRALEEHLLWQSEAHTSISSTRHATYSSTRWTQDPQVEWGC